MADDLSKVALGRETFRGSAWMTLNTAVGKLASFGAQIVLALLLTQEDFGVYAIAISISVFAAAFRDGGVRQLLIQRQTEYASLIGPVFWMAFWFNLATAGVIALLGPAAARAYGAPVLTPMLGVIALSVALGTPGAVLAARLNIDLRFRELAVVQVVGALLRYGGSVVLAWAGFGPLSFVLPLPVVSLAEWAITWWYNRERLWTRPAERRRWAELFAQTKWILLGTFAIGAFNMGNFFLVGLLVEKDVVGVYFFAYSIILQIGTLLAANSVQVLFPVFSRVEGDPERLTRGIEKCLRQLSLIGAPAAVGLIPTFGPLESLVWRGRWSEAVAPVQVLAAAYPMHIVMAVGLAALQASGLFRRWALSYIALMLGMMACGALGAHFGGTPLSIAAWLAVYLFLGSFIYLVQSVAHARVGVGAILGATLPAWLISLAAAAGACYGTRTIARMLSAGADQGESAALHPLGAFIIGGVLFVAIYVLGVRVLLRSHLDEALLVIPARARGAAAKVLGRPIPMPEVSS